MSSNQPLISTYVEPLQDKPLDGDKVKEEPVAQIADDDYKESDNDDNNQKQKNVKMTTEEFMNVSLKDLFDENDDNFDIAKKICLFYDEQFGNQDTVCMVSEIGKKPAMSYWVGEDFIRRHDDICKKRIVVYRACKHIAAKKPIASQDEFEEFVKKTVSENENASANTIGDILDEKFGEGCHFCRSDIENPQFSVYSRYSDGYNAQFRLPSGAYVVAWRR